MSARKVAYLVLLSTAIAPALLAQAVTNPNALTVTLDKDVFLLLKAAVWAGAAFVGILAAFCVSFFGFDVRKARSSIDETTTDAKKLVEESQRQLADLKRLAGEYEDAKKKLIEFVEESEQKIQEIGAKIEELADKPVNVPQSVSHGDLRSDIDLIKDVIRGTSFKWTTIERIVKRTGIPRERILELARAERSIEIGFGKKTQDNILRLRDGD